MASYFQITDTLQWSDSLDWGRKLLKAYFKNDTGYLTMVLNQSKESLKYRDEILGDPSCPKFSAIESYNFDEVYQFEYGAAFCDQAINVIVGERNDSIILFGYHYKLVYNTDSCVSFERIEKRLSRNQWDTIKLGIYRTDFWGLMPDNGRWGFDGSQLYVKGYQKPVNAFEGRYHRVYRWAAEEMELGILFKKVLDISGVNIPCFHYY